MSAGARSGAVRLGTASLMAVLGTAGCAVEPGTPPRLSLEETLGGTDTAGYARALEPVPLSFPRDLGPHPGFRTEWWYVTGHLDADDGRRFGYQLTLFRYALAPKRSATSSPWAANQAYMGHLAFTDVGAGSFQAHERFSRAAVGLAGARAQPVRVWLEDWEIRATDDSTAFPLRLRAQEGSVALDLLLEREGPPVLHGDRGLSAKGSEPGDASYYYSYTRLPTRGSVTVDGDTLLVRGASWMDREWSTGVLGAGVVGWDWFALQLDDGREVMAYGLRMRDGTTHPASEGTLVGPDGVPTRLRWGDGIRVVERDRWRAPDGVADYPSRWTVSIPAQGLSLDVRPVVPDQELRLAFRYWEGAVDVTGRGPEGPVRGRGYVELTGYAGEGRIR